MSTGTIVFVFGGTNWKISDADEWTLSSCELSGKEKILGHKKIDGAICKILQLEDGQIVALSK